ncbi:response regulator transcription factor [Paenibacillus residui]|uniref:Response regulator n=1 Tax=Paenibacillus residui TaxID=629724 RepID=A0ABW3D6L7_9BACL
MFRILIVDDERSVVDAIAQTTPWSELDIEEVFCAYSAKEALNIVGQQFIDIVLTDIRMPGMDGIELIETIRTYSNRIQFILLTGHAEFEYAQQALRLRAADYLLKPVRDEWLANAVRKLTSSMRKEWNEITSQRTTVQYLQKHLPTLRSDLLRNMLEGSQTASELNEKCALLELPYEEGDVVYPAVIRLERRTPGHSKRSLLEYSIMNIAEEVLGPMYHLWSCKDIHNYLVLILKPREKVPDGRQEESVSRLLSQLQHLVLHYLKENLSVVYGKCVSFPFDLMTVYESAVQTLRRRIGDDTGLLLTAGQSETASVLSAASVLQAPPSISHLFVAGFWEEAKAKLQSVFTELEATTRDSPIHADYLSEIYHTVLSACFHYAHTNGQTVAQALNCEGDQRFYHSPELMQSVSLLKEWSFEVCRRLSLSNQVEIQDVRKTLIEQIQEYIHSNLAEDVSLQTLATHVDMHPVYLSKVYKLETGEGLKDYLSRVRMERAVHLLLNTDLKVYEITSQVGYLNTAYFIKVFKKAFGVTPQEYRDQNSDNGGVGHVRNSTEYRPAAWARQTDSRGQ